MKISKESNQMFLEYFDLAELLIKDRNNSSNVAAAKKCFFREEELFKKVKRFLNKRRNNIEHHLKFCGRITFQRYEKTVDNSNIIGSAADIIVLNHLLCSSLDCRVIDEDYNSSIQSNY